MTGLSDSFQRPINYLRISVTDRCNLRCIYCMPGEGVALAPHDRILSYEEIRTIAAAAAGMGISKIRLTGGEPLVRLGITDLVSMLSQIDGIDDLSLTTNAIMLDRYAAELKEAGLKRVNISLDTLKEEILSGKIYLGLCLGLQLLFEESEEGGRYKGLGILKGDVIRFKGKGLKVPQIGWNQVSIRRNDCPLLKGIDDNSFFYFVHSYYVKPGEKGVTAAVTEYGGEFTSMVWKDNIYAVQFHPEKSQNIGLKFLENFLLK